MEKNIAVIWGDCSSPEIVKQTLRVLDKVAEKYGHTFHYTDAAMGGEAIDKYGDPLPQHELDKCLAADSVLLGAVGGPKWEGLPGEQRPEKGLLRLRAGMGLYSNNRPAKIWPQLAPASPLKPEIVAKGIDFIIVRELIGGVYFGKHETYTLENGEKQAVDSMPYSEHEIERIGRIGFETAMKRRKKLCCVDKANVLDTSRLWRAVMHRLQAEYPEVEYSEMFVDNCAMQVVKDPSPVSYTHLDVYKRQQQHRLRRRRPCGCALRGSWRHLHRPAEHLPELRQPVHQALQRDLRRRDRAAERSGLRGPGV